MQKPRAGFIKSAKNGLPCYLVSAFEKARVRHLFTYRAGGVSEGLFASLNFRAGAGDPRSHVFANFSRAADALERPLDSFVLTKQAHGDRVRPVEAADKGMGLLRPADGEADGLITAAPGVTLAAFYADCAVLLLYDPLTPAVGAVHSGWRGTAKDIGPKAAAQMARLYGTRPEGMLAAVGPAICYRCFETDGDVPDALSSAFGGFSAPFIEKQEAKWHVDLAGLIAARLAWAGIPPQNITLSGLCTACRASEFWSHRRQGTARGVHAAFIAL